MILFFFFQTNQRVFARVNPQERYALGTKSMLGCFRALSCFAGHVERVRWSDRVGRMEMTMMKRRRLVPGLNQESMAAFIHRLASMPLASFLGRCCCGKVYVHWQGYIGPLAARRSTMGRNRPCLLAPQTQRGNKSLCGWQTRKKEYIRQPGKHCCPPDGWQIARLDGAGRPDMMRVAPGQRGYMDGTLPWRCSFFFFFLYLFFLFTFFFHLLLFFFAFRFAFRFAFTYHLHFLFFFFFLTLRVSTLFFFPIPSTPFPSDPDPSHPTIAPTPALPPTSL